MRKTLMGASIVGVACLALASLAYGAAQVVFVASVSPNKANKSAGLKIKIVSNYGGSNLGNTYLGQVRLLGAPPK